MYLGGKRRWVPLCLVFSAVPDPDLEINGGGGGWGGSPGSTTAVCIIMPFQKYITLFRICFLSCFNKRCVKLVTLLLKGLCDEYISVLLVKSVLKSLLSKL